MHRKSKAPRRGASIGWQAMSITVRSDDCDVDVVRAGEFYMVKPGLWSQTWPEMGGQPMCRMSRKPPRA